MTLVIAESFALERAGRKRSRSVSTFAVEENVSKKTCSAIVVPPRPKGNGFAARLWDNLYNKTKTEEKQSPLKSDVLAMLKKNSVSSTKKQLFPLLGEKLEPVVRPKAVSKKQVVVVEAVKPVVVQRKVAEVASHAHKFYTSHRVVSPFSSSSQASKYVESALDMKSFVKPDWL